LFANLLQMQTRFVISLFLICMVHPVIAQWNYMNPAPSPEGYSAIQFVGEQLGYAISPAGTLVQTMDAGLHWAIIKPVSFPQSYCTDMCFVSASKGWIIGVKGMILKTPDAGHTWDILPSGTTSDLLSIDMVSESIGYIIGIHGIILKTTDGGNSWQLIVPDIVRDMYDCFFTDEQQGFAAADKSILKTLDGGNTWTEVLHADSGYNFIRVNFTSPLAGFAVGRKGGIFKTADGGANWTRIPVNTDKNLTGICFTNNHTGHITGNNGIMLRSTDAGNSWSILNTGFPYNFDGLAFSNDNNGAAYGPLGAIFHTSDGGITWSPATFCTLDNLWAISFANEQVGFVAGSAGAVGKTLDGGNTWSMLSTGTQKSISSILMVSPDVGYLAGEQGLILKTINGGASWQQVTSPDAINWSSLYFKDADNGMVSGISPVIYVTKNGGNSWTGIQTETNAAINSMTFSGSVGYACGSTATLLKTTNFGSSWSKIIVPELYEANLNKIICVDENNCFVMGNQYVTNAWVMFFAATADGGATWKVKTFEFSPSKTFMSMCFTDAQTGYAGGSDFLWKTKDAGDNWIDQTPEILRSGPNEIRFVNHEVGFAVGYSGQILSTSNGGGLGVNNPSAASVKILDQNSPNPFHGTTQIAYRIREAGRVSLVIYDLYGKYVMELVNAVQPEGFYRIKFDGSGILPGVYFYRLTNNRVSDTRKLVIY